MSNGSDEKRKIIIDANAAIVANRGIIAAARGELTAHQITELIACDRRYIAMVRTIAPALCEGIPV